MESHAVVLADVTGRICFWSEGAQAAFGYSAGEAVGRMLDLIIPPEFHDAHWAGFGRAIRLGRAEAEGRPSPFPVRRADGHVTETLGRLALLRTGDDRVIGAMVVFNAAGL